MLSNKRYGKKKKKSKVAWVRLAFRIGYLVLSNRKPKKRRR